MTDIVERLEDPVLVKMGTDLAKEAANAIRGLRQNRDLAQQEIERLRDALKHYANREMWRKEPGDSFVGEFDCFDWDGDLADEPYEIARKALGDTE